MPAFTPSCRRRVAAPLVARLQLAAVLFLASGCAGLFGPSITPPEVSIAGVALSRPGLTSQELTFTFRLRNRLDRELLVEAISFDLDVAGDRLGSGLLLKELSLPAAGEATVAVPVTVRTSDLLDALMRLPQRQDLSYALEGELRLRGERERSLPISVDGALSLPRLPAGAICDSCRANQWPG